MNYNYYTRIGKLEPLANTVKSFYGKAEVATLETFDGQNFVLLSYGSEIVRLNEAQTALMIEEGVTEEMLTQTTLRHIAAFCGARVKKSLLHKMVAGRWYNWEELEQLAEANHIRGAVAGATGWRDLRRMAEGC